MMSSPLLSFPFPLRLHETHGFPFKPSLLSFSVSTSGVCFSSQNPSRDDREEVRWLREEQRWLREEQRWMREEQRWIRERESLILQIAELKHRIEVLESRNSTQGTSVTDTISSVAALLQVLKEKNRIADSGSSATPIVFEEKKTERKEREEEEEEEEEDEKRVTHEEVRVSETEEKRVNLDRKRMTLRSGSEGEEVREMQEALLRLGFYSGEEDMEYSSFSSGTERAVKTWQASLGVPEDGIMTVQLLERLYMDQLVHTVGSDKNMGKEVHNPVKQEEGGNGAAVASVTEISEMRQMVVKDEGAEEVKVSRHRVFLLGENRWEEPSRLVGRNQQDSVKKSANTTTKCLTCRGEGRIMCTECDGTGEPNLEPQFIEWVGEGANCPYCEGLGYTICDLCEGKASV